MGRKRNTRKSIPNLAAFPSWHVRSQSNLICRAWRLPAQKYRTLDSQTSSQSPTCCLSRCLQTLCDLQGSPQSDILNVLKSTATMRLVWLPSNDGENSFQLQLPPRLLSCSKTPAFKCFTLQNPGYAWRYSGVQQYSLPNLTTCLARASSY